MDERSSGADKEISEQRNTEAIYKLYLVHKVDFRKEAFCKQRNPKRKEKQKIDNQVGNKDY